MGKHYFTGRLRDLHKLPFTNRRHILVSRVCPEDVGYHSKWVYMDDGNFYYKQRIPEERRVVSKEERDELFTLCGVATASEMTLKQYLELPEKEEIFGGLHTDASTVGTKSASYWDDFKRPISLDEIVFFAVSRCEELPKILTKNGEFWGHVNGENLPNYVCEKSVENWRKNHQKKT